MKLKTLSIENFKGIKKFCLDAEGKNISIFGDNGAGKTTVADSIAWLLYDQDSQGSSLQPKTLSITGEATHGISSDVEAVFFTDAGSELKLKKSFFEKWTKKRGSAKAAFTGHITNYYVDDVPVKKKEYVDRINGIASESILKFLTNVSYFADKLHWQDRRSILLDICGDISDADIIASSKKLSGIPEILNGKSFEDQKKIIVSKKTKLNKELNDLPVRIDEVDKNLPDMTDIEMDIKDIEINQDVLSKQLAAANEKKVRIESGGEIAEKTKELRTIEAEKLNVENQDTALKFQEKAKIEKDKLALETSLEAEESNRKKFHSAVQNNLDKNKLAEKSLIRLRENWKQINDSVFDINDTICPTCGQDYPPEKAKEIRDTFNINGSKNLEDINKTGEALSAEIAERKKDNESFEADIISYDESIEKLEKQISEVFNDEKPSEFPKQKKLKNDIEKIEASIEGLRSGSKDAMELAQKEIDDITGKIAAVNLQKQEIDNYKKGLARVDELSEQQKVCAAEFEKLEEKLFIMEEFIRAKVALLENKVNDKFKLAKFKLFDIQVNGGLTECCEVTYKGVPWNAGLNNGAKINVGLDIINTLSDFYGLTMPVFIDNAESVTQTIDSKSQIIKLIVDETNQQLMVRLTVK